MKTVLYKNPSKQTLLQIKRKLEKSFNGEFFIKDTSYEIQINYSSKKLKRILYGGMHKRKKYKKLYWKTFCHILRIIKKYLPIETMYYIAICYDLFNEKESDV